MILSRFRLFLLVALAAGAAQAQTGVPAAGAAISAQNLSPGGGSVAIDLRNHFSVPGITGEIVQIDFSGVGRINLEMLANDAPKSVENFKSYISAGRYQGTYIHRAITGFVIQGGGYNANSPTTHIPTFAAVQNEFKLGNIRGTVAMAKLGNDPNSATSEWFINLADNRANLDNQNGGFTVFARVIGNGMVVADAIAGLPRANAGGAFTDLPVRNLTGSNITAANLVVINSISTATIFPTGSGASVVSFTAVSSNPAVVTATLSGSTLTLTAAGGGTASVTVTATDSHGSTAVQSVTVTVSGPSASRLPVITAQPPPQITLASGTTNTVVFSVAANATPAPTYQWRRNGVAVTGQTSQTYVLTNASDAQAGRFTCLVSNSEGSVESEPSIVSFVSTTPANRGRLSNLSILSPLAANEVLTLGTVLGGAGTSGPKALLTRAAGPSLTRLGVEGVLPDPQMSLLARSGTAVASNNDWAGTTALSAAFDQVGAFPYAAANSKDAAIYSSNLESGGYTVQVRDTTGGAGVAIVELYDSTPASAFTATTPRLVNVSVLKQIPDGSALTAGFVIGGTTAKTVLVRAVGPTLAAFGVTETMSDPLLTLFNASSVRIAENDNWGGDAEIALTASRVGAFDLAPANSNDAVLLVSLAPGNYTARVSGNRGGGSVLVEVYEVP